MIAVRSLTSASTWSSRICISPPMARTAAYFCCFRTTTRGQFHFFRMLIARPICSEQKNPEKASYAESCNESLPVGHATASLSFGLRISRSSSFQFFLSFVSYSSILSLYRSCRRGGHLSEGIGRPAPAVSGSGPSPHDHVGYGAAPSL